MIFWWKLGEFAQLCSSLSVFESFSSAKYSIMKFGISNSLIVFSVLCLISLPNVSAYFLVIDAHAEDCFFDRVSSGTKMGLTFEVVDGGFLDIDVMIKGLLCCFFVHSKILISNYYFPSFRAWRKGYPPRGASFKRQIYVRSPYGRRLYLLFWQ